MLNMRVLPVQRLGWVMLGLFLASCVTINIYFPAAAAEEAARTIVRDVLGKDQQAQPPSQTPSGQAPVEQPQSAVPVNGARWLAEQLLNAFVPTAEAAGAPNIDISTPAIIRLRNAMAQRQKQLAPFYRSGAIGFAAHGLVAERDMASVSLRDRNRLRSLVSAENADRNALYREIARANGHPEWEKDVRATFAKVWVQEAPKGYWYQTADKRWRQR
jgi:uncharacterized protein